MWGITAWINLIAPIEKGLKLSWHQANTVTELVSQTIPFSILTQMNMNIWCFPSQALSATNWNPPSTNEFPIIHETRILHKSRPIEVSMPRRNTKIPIQSETGARAIAVSNSANNLAVCVQALPRVRIIWRLVYWFLLMMDTRNVLSWVMKDFHNLAPLLGWRSWRVNFTSQMPLEKVVIQTFTGNNLKSKRELQGSHNLYEGSGKSETYRETMFAGKCCISSWFWQSLCIGRNLLLNYFWNGKYTGM